MEERVEEILADYERRLRETENLLVAGEGEDRKRLEKWERLLLRNAAGALRGEDPSLLAVDRYPNMGEREEMVNAHPDESFRAGMALSRAAIETIVRDVPPETPPGEVLKMGLIIQESILDQISQVATISYTNYLFTKIHETRLEERRRFSRELHDRVAHSMAVVGQNLEMHDALKTTYPVEAKSKLQRAKTLVRDSINLVRNISVELRGAEADEGLELALENLLRTSVSGSMEYGVTTAGNESSLPEYVRDQLYLILREGIRNAVTHSRSKRIEVDMRFSPDEVTGVIADYGSGFDAGAHSGDGVGLKSMKERASLLGGRLAVESTSDGGTRARVSIPLTNGQRDGH